MTAQDYPVTFGYGATDGVYYGPNGSIGPYHRGDDRAMPNGTPVVVNGVQIGLSNNTGASSGSHLHIGRFEGGTDTNPNSEGFNLKAPVTVTTVSSDGINGNYIRLTDGDGVRWVYLHLQSQSVTQGQILSKKEEVPMLNEGDVINLYKSMLGRDPNAQEIAIYKDKDWKTVVYAFLGSDEFKARVNGDFTPVSETLFRRKWWNFHQWNEVAD